MKGWKSKPNMGKGEMPFGKGSLADAFGMSWCLTGAHLDLQGKSASHRATRLSM